MLLTSSLHGYFIDYQCLCRYVGNVGNGASYNYTFTYDGVNRMLNATHGTGAYTEKVTLYDKNGNIKALQRYGNGLIDNLTYTYSGNQLTKVEDATGNAAGFSNGANVANEYTYDNNGNLTKEGNKNISSIEYNSFNLPNVVTFSGGNSITYTYAADGTKLRTAHKMGGVTVTTDYCSNVIYESGAQKRLLTEEGYVDLSVTTPAYYYFLKDHQGNNRVVINNSGTVSETNHYYPFGSVFASTGNVQPYKYNGKELDTKCGLNWYDYGARHYDAVLGRWHSVDPLAEKMGAWSPYAYCFNNSIKFIDNNGEVPNVVIGAIIGGIVSGSMAIYDGKGYKEVLAATVGGAVSGAIAATGAAFLGGFVGDATEQIANLITDSKQELDYNSMIVSSVTGSVFGKVGDTFESTIKKASSNMMNSIDTKYRSSKFQKTIKEEIKREVSTTGQRIGNASRKQINSKTNERIKALKKSDETFIEGVKNVISIFIESVNSYFNNIVNDRIKKMKNKGDSIHEEYTMHGNIWIKTIIIIVLCVFSFIVLLPNAISGELFSLVLLITVFIINIYEFCRQYKNQGTMRINHLGIQIISWNGFCPSKKNEMKIYKWNEIKKIELQFFFNSYPKLYVLTTDNKKDKIEMFPYLTFYLNEKEFRKCFSRFCPQEKILYIS